MGHASIRGYVHNLRFHEIEIPWGTFLKAIWQCSLKSKMCISFWPNSSISRNLATRISHACAQRCMYKDLQSYSLQQWKRRMIKQHIVHPSYQSLCNVRKKKITYILIWKGLHNIHLRGQQPSPRKIYTAWSSLCNNKKVAYILIYVNAHKKEREALSCCQWLYLGTGVGGREYFTFCFCISALSFQLEHSNVSHTSF